MVMYYAIYSHGEIEIMDEMSSVEETLPKEVPSVASSEAAAAAAASAG